MAPKPKQIIASLSTVAAPTIVGSSSSQKKEAHCLDDSKVSYQNLTDDLQRSEIVTKGTEGVIASVRAVIAKPQALIHDNELKITNEKKRMEELKAAKSRHNRNLMSILRDWKLFRHNLLRRGFYPMRS